MLIAKFKDEMLAQKLSQLQTSHLQAHRHEHHELGSNCPSFGVDPYNFFDESTGVGRDVVDVAVAFVDEGGILEGVLGLGEETLLLVSDLALLEDSFHH